MSTATVSRVMNKSGPVADHTVERVHQAMADLNYMPHASARRLAGHKTNTLGLLFPVLSGIFISELLSGIEQTALDAITVDVNWDSGVDAGQRDMVSRQLVDKLRALLGARMQIDVRQAQPMRSPDFRETFARKQHFVKGLPDETLSRLTREGAVRLQF